jgi:hypothetical protein
MSTGVSTGRAKISLVDNKENGVLEWARISSIVKRIDVHDECG